MGFRYDYERGGGRQFASSDVRVVSVIGTIEPVTLAEAKTYLRIKHDRDDALITALISNAREDAEREIQSDILSKQRIHYLSRYDSPFNLYYAPISSVDQVSIDGEVISSEEYELLGLDNPKLMLNNGSARNLQVTYTTSGRITEGTGDAEGTNIDHSLRFGILSLIAWKYYGRTAEDKNINTNWKSWLRPYKTANWYGVN